MQECLNEVSFPDFLEALSNLLLRASYDALDFLSLRNLLSNKLFFTFCKFTTVPFYFNYNIFSRNSFILFLTSTAFLGFPLAVIEI